MLRSGVKKMGRFSVQVELANNDDVVLAQLGQIKPGEIRRVTVAGLIDTGATRLVIPKRIAQQLGLRETGQVGVRYADGRQTTRPLVDGVHLSMLGRSSVFKAMVEPRRIEALVGAIVLEDLDFLVDATHQRLVPRDPKMIISEAE
jgi:predicted aspartyl protease